MNFAWVAVPMLFVRKLVFIFLTSFVFSVLPCCRCQGQAALLLEEPYGFFGTVNPTGHNAIYFSRICADTPVKLRRCEPGELGSVIARYQGINIYDWVAVPLIPYLYSVENISQIPDHVDRRQVNMLRDRYFEAHLQGLGDADKGNLVHGGWTQLIGTSYERRTYVFKFDTSPEQDDAIISMLNDRTNQSHFNLFYNNCADFARQILNIYFPRTFRRGLFPDAGMTTPKQITYRLVRYSRKHPDAGLQIFEIPQIPGYRRMSHANKSISESLTTTAYAIPIFLMNPYIAGGLFVDYLARGRFHLILRNPAVLKPDELYALTDQGAPFENRANAGSQAAGAAAVPSAEIGEPSTANSGLEGIRIRNE